MGEGRLERLQNLRFYRGVFFVGQPLVLRVDIRELGLKKELLPRVEGGAALRGERFTDEGFDVVPALVGGIDGGEAGPQREPRELGGAPLLPSGSVNEGGHGNSLHVPQRSRSEHLFSIASSART